MDPEKNGQMVVVVGWKDRGIQGPTDKGGSGRLEGRLDKRVVMIDNSQREQKARRSARTVWVDRFVVWCPGCAGSDPGRMERQVVG
jgi:hypothetical protein